MAASSDTDSCRGQYTEKTLKDLRVRFLRESACSLMSVSDGDGAQNSIFPRVGAQIDAQEISTRRYQVPGHVAPGPFKGIGYALDVAPGPYVAVC